MTRLVRAEWRKLFTTKLWWGMLIGAVAFTAIGVTATVLSAGHHGAAPLDSGEAQRNALGSAGAAVLFIIVVGVIGITTEYRHYTSRPTFLIEPRRARVIVAKLIAYAGLGLLYAVVTTVVAVAMTLPWASAKGVHISLADNDIPRVLVGSMAAVAIYGIVGLGVGVLARNQILGVIAALAYLFVLEPLIRVIPGVRSVYPYLPGAAGQGLTAATREMGDVTLLEPWVSGVVLVAWGLFFALLGTLLTTRRDVP